MPVNTQQFSENVRQFNEKYGTNFNLTTFAGKAKAFGMVKGANAANEVYLLSVGNIVRDILAGVINGTGKESDIFKAIEDFENQIMKPFSKACKDENEDFCPSPYGGVKKEERINLVERIFKGFPKSSLGLATKEYLDGNLRIRDMVAFTKEATSGQLDNSKFKRACAFVKTLEEVNKSRSGVWKFFHPFRNRAEKRDAKVMENLLKGFNETLYHINQTPVIAEPTEFILFPTFIAQKRSEVKLEEEQIKIDEIMKPKVEVFEANEKEEELVFEEEKELPKIFQIGYRPEPKTILGDLKVANQISDMIKNNEIPSEYAVKICKENIARFKEIKQQYFLNNSDEEFTQELIDNKEAEWKEKDNQFSKENPNYKPNSLDQVKEALEPVIIDIEEGKDLPVSPKVKEEIIEQKVISNQK